MCGYRETLQDIEKKRAFVSVLCKLFFKGHKKTLFEPLQIRDEFQPSLNYLQQNCLIELVKGTKGTSRIHKVPPEMLWKLQFNCHNFSAI